MSRLTDLIRKTKAENPKLGEDLEREFRALSSRLSFGLNFERHNPEAVELPNRQVRKGDKVRVLPPRGDTRKGDQRLWRVKAIRKSKKVADLELPDAEEPEAQTLALDDLVVIAEFGDIIYPGLVSTGKVSRCGKKPSHSVINGENYHVLKALTWTHRGKVDAIYIDPPYNTGAKDWKYNNDYVDGEDQYRHSKWLAMMERRLLVAKELLNPADSVLIVTIDEKEYLRLGLLLEQVFPEANIQMVSALVNPAAVARVGGFGRSDEYIFFVMLGNSAPARLRLDREWVSGKGRTHTGKIRWDLLRRSGTNTERSHSPGCFYPIYINPDSRVVEKVGDPLLPGVSKAPSVSGLVAILPIRQDKSEGNWQWSPVTFRKRLREGRVRIGGNTKRGFTVYILKPGEFEKIQSGEFKEIGRATDGSLLVEENDPSVVTAIPGTQWKIASHDATQYGSRMLSKLVPGKFPFPKSLYAVEDALRFFTKGKPEAVVLDFFSGSGTTAHAVMRLNKQDGGNRQCISVTNNEVSADEQKSLRERGLRPGDPDWEKLGICDYITKPRVEAAITGKAPAGNPIEGSYQFGKTVDKEKPRNFKHIDFCETSIVNSAVKKKRFLALIDDLPQTLVKEICSFIVSEKHTSSVLFDTQFEEDWLRALDGQTHITDFYVFTPDSRTFNTLKKRVSELLGPITVREKEETTMSDGFEENAEFFTLTYETPLAVSYQTAFARIAPLLWLRAGSMGERIDKLPVDGWDLVDAYGLLIDLDRTTDFLKAVRKANQLRIAYIVTDDERRFQSLTRRLPAGVEAIRLYESYLTNFAFANGDDV